MSTTSPMQLIKTGSLIKAIESLPKGERGLVRLSGDVPPEVDQWVPESELLGPGKTTGTE